MTGMNRRSVAVGVFEDRTNAERAIDELHRAGFTDNEIGFAVRGEGTTGTTAEANAADAGTGAVTGAVSGGVLGGLIGAGAALLIPGIGPAVAGGILAATLTGAAVGAAAGGLIGALTGMGIPEEEASYYQSEFESGRVIVTVNAPNRQQEALEILRRNGAYDITTRGTQGTAYAGTTGTTTTSTTTSTGYPASTTGTGRWEDVSAQYRSNWQQRYGSTGGRWEDFEPGYRYGWEMATNPQYQGRQWTEVEPEFRRDWETRYPNTRWEQASPYIRESWESGYTTSYRPDISSNMESRQNTEYR
jgi:hypothetical protein